MGHMTSTEIVAYQFECDVFLFEIITVDANANDAQS